MRTEEDEAFDELAKKQGDWGGGFPAKRAMAAGKLHWSDCAVHNGPAYPAGECDCDARLSKYAETLLEEATRSCNNIDEQRALDALMLNFHKPAQESEILTIVYQSGYHDGKQAALAGREWNFCERCGKRTADLTVIHTCTPPQPAQEAIYGMNQDDWKDVVAAIAKVRDGRGIYLGCRPTDVFKDWFLALGTAKVKEKNT